MLAVGQIWGISLATIYPKSNGIIKCNQMLCIIAVYILLSYSALESKTSPHVLHAFTWLDQVRGSLGPCFTILTSPAKERLKKPVFITRQPILFVNKKANIFLTPRSSPNEDWLEVRHQEGGLLINQTQITNLELLVAVHFEVCAAINRNPWSTIKCVAYHGNKSTCSMTDICVN